MQHITTKYLPETNTRGARIKATPSVWKTSAVTIPYHYELSGGEAHWAAAKALCEKIHNSVLNGWQAPMIGSQCADGNWVFVFANDEVFNHIEDAQEGGE